MTLIARKTSYLFLLVCITLFINAGMSGAATLNVSTKPLHSLAASIMKNVGAPTLILDNVKSLHQLNLAPSTIRRLQSAEIVIWMGAKIEPHLQNALKAVPSETKIHDLGNSASNNIHWWTDPGMALALVTPLSKIIIESDPKNTAAYEANANALADRLETMISEISNSLDPVSNIRFLTLHEAYSPFNFRFELEGGEAIERGGVIGAKTIARLHSELKQSKIQCVFGEVGENAAILATLLEGTKAKSAPLDALGLDLAAGPQYYEDLIRQIATTYKTCFSAE